jgi:hypothetical protein
MPVQRLAISRDDGWLPVGSAPVGLITWYAPGGPVAVLASWLAVINGHPPELRAGCSGRVADRRDLPEGSAFAINIPATPGGPILDELIARAASAPVTIDAAAAFSLARSVHAPLLAGCALQLECAHGRILPGEWEPEIVGDIVLLHRGGLLLDPADYPDFCALRPLRTVFPS